MDWRNSKEPGWLENKKNEMMRQEWRISGNCSSCRAWVPMVSIFVFILGEVVKHHWFFKLLLFVWWHWVFTALRITL